MFAIVRATRGRRSDVCATLGQTLHTYRTSKLRYHAGRDRDRGRVRLARRVTNESRPEEKEEISRRSSTHAAEREDVKAILRVSAARRTQPGDSIHRSGRSAFSRNTPSSRCHDAWQSTKDRSTREHRRWIDRSPRPRIRCVPSKTYAIKRKDTWKNCTPRGERS